MSTTPTPTLTHSGASKSAGHKCEDHSPDDGISIRCLTIATRNGHTRRAAERCQINERGQGGSVGCPDCPYNRPETYGKRIQ